MYLYWLRCQGKRLDAPKAQSGVASMSPSLTILRANAPAAPEDVEVGRLDVVPDPRLESDHFVREQIRGLVRKVFVPGWPRPARQVVFSAASPEVDMTSICFRTAETLASEGAGRICLVEADLRSRALERNFGRTVDVGHSGSEVTGAVRESSRQVSHNLWIVSADTFLGEPENANSAIWLRGRLGDLRREFDYSVIHCAPATEWAGMALLANLADGLVLGLEAHRTRRLAAKSLRDQLVAANVRLLGIVLTERRFPIPERLYRRL
jgi:Mrp family chromosome partitioning ATPase